MYGMVGVCTEVNYVLLLINLAENKSELPDNFR
jgi:hypothetical protein